MVANEGFNADLERRRENQHTNAVMVKLIDFHCAQEMIESNTNHKVVRQYFSNKQNMRVDFAICSVGNQSTSKAYSWINLWGRGERRGDMICIGR